MNTRSKPIVELNSIQFLRAVACLLVVAHHTIRAYTANSDAGWTKPWLVDDKNLYDVMAIGVDVFFVISGFIMVRVSQAYIDKRKPISDFLYRRVVRIYPPYLIVTCVLILLAISVYVRRGEVSFDLGAYRIVSSLLLFPSYNSSHFIQPILGVGWTLSYEMYFYIVFALAIFLFGKNFLVPMIAFLLAVIILARVFDATGAFSAFLKNTIVIEFILGCLVARVLLPVSKVPVLRLWPVALAFGAALLIVFTPTPTTRFIFWGIPSALVVLFLLCGELKGYRSYPKTLILLGDASYSIYLVHVPLIYILGIKVSTLLGVTTSSPQIVLLSIIADFTVATVAGLGFYWFLERPLNLFFKTRHLPWAPVPSR